MVRACPCSPAVQLTFIVYLIFVPQAANNQKFDDWHAMYSILEDQYFKEYVENAPPVLPSGNYFTRLSQQMLALLGNIMKFICH